MPVVYTKIDMDDVLAVLKQKGYGFHSSRQYPVQLNVPSKTRFRKIDGMPHRDLLKGITAQERDAILTRSDTVEAAALLFEQMSVGERMSAVEETAGAVASDGLTADQIAHLISNRVNLAVNDAVATVRSEMANLKAEMGEMIASVRELLETKAPKPKKAQKEPTASPKRTDAEVDAILDSMGVKQVVAPPPEA